MICLNKHIYCLQHVTSCLKSANDEWHLNRSLKCVDHPDGQNHKHTEQRPQEPRHQRRGALQRFITWGEHDKTLKSRRTETCIKSTKTRQCFTCCRCCVLLVLCASLSHFIFCLWHAAHRVLQLVKDLRDRKQTDQLIHSSFSRSSTSGRSSSNRSPGCWARMRWRPPAARRSSESPSARCCSCGSCTAAWRGWGCSHRETRRTTSPLRSSALMTSAWCGPAPARPTDHPGSACTRERPDIQGDLCPPETQHNRFRAKSRYSRRTDSVNDLRHFKSDTSQ